MSRHNSKVETELKMLLRAVRRERFRFIIIQYNHFGLLKTVKENLQENFPQRSQTSIDVSIVKENVLIPSILECTEGFLFLERFEALFDEKNKTLAIGLNQRRDRFSKTSIVLFAFLPYGDAYLRECQKILPDLFAIASPIIQLEEKIKQNIRSLSTPVLSIPDLGFDSAKDARTEVRRIEKRLQELPNTEELSMLKISLLNKLGEAYQFLGEFHKAKQIFEDLLTVLKNAHQNNILGIAEVENNLACVYQDLGDYNSAILLLKSSLETHKSALGENNTVTAAIYSNLALVYLDKGDDLAAKELLQLALESNKINLGEKHPVTAANYSNLGIVFQRLGKLDVAKGYLEKAIESNELNIGKTHRSTANMYSNLASIVSNLGDYETAKKLIETAITINKSNLGRSHPTIGLNYSTLSSIYLFLNKHDSALKFAKKAQEVLQKTLPISHPQIMKIQSNIAIIKAVMKEI